jgi:spermidine synthase
MRDGIYIFEEEANRAYGEFFKIEQIVYKAQSEYQEILIYDNPLLGRVLALDGVFNTAPIMEAHYHEPMAHIPLAMLSRREGPFAVLIIGGGDFGVARQVLKHSWVDEVTLCELDPMVISAVQEHFPEWAECRKDPRLKVWSMDGVKFLEKCNPDHFDAIIVDSTDPSVAAQMLVREEFYNQVCRTLGRGGVFMQIIGDPIFYKEGWDLALPAIKPYFKQIRPVFVPIPFYLTGCWGLLLARNEGRLGPECVSQQYLDELRVETMTADLVRGWFSIPPWVFKQIPILVK